MIEPDHCLICYQTLDGGDHVGFSTVSKELNAVFILRKIFEVPLESLTDYMMDNDASNPSEWIRLCNDSGGTGTCKLMVDKAKKIYKEILDAKRRFRKVKGDIIQFLRRNQQRRLKTKGGAGGRRRTSFGFTDQTRKFVSEHDYSESLVDPFIGGDCQAEKLLYSSNIVPEVDDDMLLRKIIKEERCQADDENQVEIEEDTFFEDDLVENGDHDQSSLSSPSASTAANDNNEDKDPLFSVPSTSTTLNTIKRSGGRKRMKKEKEVVAHIKCGTTKNSDGEDQWNCSCGRKYTSSMQLQRHVREATMEESCLYNCPLLCGKGFRRRWDVKRHLSRTHGLEDTDKLMEGMKYKKRRKEGEGSEEGGGGGDSQGEVPSGRGHHTFEEESQKMEDGTEYWRCSCGKIYLARETLLKHVKEVGVGEAVDGDYVRRNWVGCTVCGVKFKWRIELNRHVQQKHGLESRVGMEREVDGGGDQEGAEENGGGGESRRVVRKSEGVVGGLEGEHEQVGLMETLEDGTEQWKCSCGKLYASKEAMCRHVKEKNLDPSKWIGCPHCVKSFKRRSELTRHVNGVHSKKKGRGKEGMERECEFCGEEFVGVGELKMHQRNQCANALDSRKDDDALEEDDEKMENREEAQENLISFNAIY